ncbi:hypothetical protein [Oricola cellulosilytica]|uniref:hypothetical protein n=1 Tax=Oricola cellulosilytica TaxID=1429082 RepID=UPI001304D6C8|nr:hypothetical protein [Oricola cellulosilytica]
MKCAGKVNRRNFLSGFVTLVVGCVFQARKITGTDRIVMRDGWILKESDLRDL